MWNYFLSFLFVVGLPHKTGSFMKMDAVSVPFTKMLGTISLICVFWVNKRINQDSGIKNCYTRSLWLMEFFIRKAFVVLFAALDFPTGNSHGDCCFYLLNCVAMFFCFTSCLRYRPSGWTCKWVGWLHGKDSVLHVSLLKGWDPPLLLGGRYWG